MRTVHRWAWLFLTLVLVGVSVATVQRMRRSGLPEIAIVPAFRMTDQHARAVSLADLKGRVWIANFMFTSCPDVCPLLTERMAGLRRRLAPEGDAVRFVSFSVDPETDTPDVLARYARSHAADYPNWSFLTGPADDVRRVVVEGFKESMQALREPDHKANVLHGSHFVLVDERGTIRGYYPSEPAGINVLAHDAATLVASEGGA